MQITEAQLDSFIELYKKRFGIEIARDKALEKATKLLTLMTCIYRPITKEQYEKYSKPSSI
ncbi:MAG: hypothetical protein UR28_C0028G0022 [Candidatus Peregrinibacteria bacterium GW2011_GWF2_33_10]|nr:MAG: hypothetical protein UR28_C0028G0022 [Candidatus Peregrinibacteria bacterium GW2011_GWF2_33_10]OGJ45853.1 MAG: hypothetical protein A2263_03615 [Candidatus Peregrinibacteria bacterium RIFOXYA2_FULL_33_21]OGJ51355.1 MAG: hypothetical protein A2307_02280 [Candidatus Peregrinibacteria bacterium RIFOXYB2_FULL_33_20]